MSRFPWLDGVVDWGEEAVDSAVNWGQNLARDYVGNNPMANPNVSVADQFYGAAEAGVDTVNKMAQMSGAGMAGMGAFGNELISGNGVESATNQAVETIRSSMEDPLWAFEAETPVGQRYVSLMNELERPVESFAAAAGDVTADMTGSPLLGAIAKSVPEVVGGEGLAAALTGKGLQGAADVGQAATNTVMENAFQGPTAGMPQAQEGAIKIQDDETTDMRGRYGTENLMGEEMTPVESAIAAPPEVIAQQYNIEGGVDEITSGERGGVFTPNVWKAVDNAPKSEMTGKKWSDYLQQRGISPEELNYSGIDEVLNQNKDSVISAEQLKQTPDTRGAIIRRSGQGVADRDGQVEHQRTKKAAMDSAREAGVLYRDNFNSNEPYEANFNRANNNFAQGNASIAMDYWGKAKTQMINEGVDKNVITELEGAMQRNLRTAEQFHRVDANGTGGQPAEFGGSQEPSYNREYKYGGHGDDEGTLGNYIALVNQRKEGFGGRGRDFGHYNSPDDEFNVIQNRLSRRPVQGETFEGEGGALFDTTTTHLDESQSDLHQKQIGYGRDLTPIEQAEYGRLDQERERHDNTLKDIGQKREAIKSLIEHIESGPPGPYYQNELAKAAKRQPDLFGDPQNPTMGQLRDKHQDLGRESRSVRDLRDDAGRKAAEVAGPSNSQTPDANWKDKTQRRVKSMMIAISDAIKRGDEYVTIANRRQQGMAYDSFEYVDDVVYRDDGFYPADNYSGYAAEIPESEIARVIPKSELDNIKQNPLLDEDDFYAGEREYYVENEAEQISYEMEDAVRYRDDYGDLHEEYGDAVYRTESGEPDEIDGVDYEGEFYEGDINTLADDIAEDRVPHDGEEIRHMYDYGGDVYDEYKQNTAATISIGDDLITNSDVAGTAKWYEDDYNENAARQLYRELGLEPPESFEYKEIPTTSDVGDTDMVMSIPITPELIEAMDNAPLFNRYIEPSGWWDRKNARDARREAERAGMDWIDQLEVYSSYPRGSKKNVDPRPPLLTVDEISDSDYDTGSLLWPDDPK